MVVQVKAKARGKDMNPTKQVVVITTTSQMVVITTTKQVVDSTTTQIRENVKMITTNQNHQEIIVSSRVGKFQYTC